VNKQIIVLLITILLVIVPVLSVIVFSINYEERYVMHASGGYEGQKYLNSVESFDYHISQGNTLFEIDFLYTSDGQIVCSHGFENIGGYSLSNKPTYEQFKQSLVNGKYKPLLIDHIVKKIKINPQVKIIFDSKESDKVKIFSELYDILLEQGFNPARNLILQIYNYQDYLILKDYKVKEFWFTNYMAGYSQSKINEYFGNESKITTIVMPYQTYLNYVKSGLIIKKDIAVHGINYFLTKENSKDIDVKYVFVHQ